MDLEAQGRIEEVRDQQAIDGMIAVLGANSSAAVEMVATLQSGDRAGRDRSPARALGISSFHVLEPEIAVQIDPALYERDLALTTMVMDVDEVAAPLKALRG